MTLPEVQDASYLIGIVLALMHELLDVYPFPPSPSYEHGVIIHPYVLHSMNATLPPPPLLQLPANQRPLISRHSDRQTPEGPSGRRNHPPHPMLGQAWSSLCWRHSGPLAAEAARPATREARPLHVCGACQAAIDLGEMMAPPAVLRSRRQARAVACPRALLPAREGSRAQREDWESVILYPDSVPSGVKERRQSGLAPLPGNGPVTPTDKGTQQTGLYYITWTNPPPPSSGFFCFSAIHPPPTQLSLVN
ncbi:hypothetical protein ASPZODRAFT_192169 [Penicilliopsis zonata CBS 506.65]|uniref:Uncharacterized protein n=1 Tax=Penicilliopsis zonata CBS 506.65 TaxID=1073090 RepID=A0A1L9STH4_9EURO|nr:hypothetical protein ASPZODRAFT_192169 [Penicilliopsis zonata CBS 506.65]OJJ50499.1 hypothetical protein ASPZODRAFT_192169 [Penicilliopsis zonata CBS 506.65]